MLGINLVAVVLCGVGFLGGWRVIRRGRLPFESEDALLSWKVRDLLSDKRIQGVSPRFPKRWLSGFLSLLTILLVLLGAFWIYQVVAEWVWFLYAVGIVGFAAGGRAIVHM